MTPFGFKENVADQYIYLNVSGRKFIFRLYVDNFLLAINDIGLNHKTKRMLCETYEMNVLREASFLCIEINKDFLIYWVYLEMPTIIVCLKDLIQMVIYPVMFLCLREIYFLNLMSIE